MMTRSQLGACLIAGASLVCCGAALGQTATGVLNVQLLNGSGLTLTFISNAAGVKLGNSGTYAATLGLGTISAYGVLGKGVTRSAVTANNFTVSTSFDVKVAKSGTTSSSYTLAAALAAAPPTGFAYTVDSVVLTTTDQSLETTAKYGTNVAHTLNVVVSTLATGSGGPAIGTPLTATINFLATAN